jgi:putative membrane protein
MSLRARARAHAPELLFAAWLVLWIALAIDPVYRADWLLENLLVFAAVPALVLTRNRMRFSNAAYACLAVFFALHAIGAHYTYSIVPYDAWFEQLTGRGLNAMLGWSRNNYDRFVHFAYGALLLLPSSELLDRIAPPRGWWRLLLPVLFIASHSVVYELIEFAAAIVFGGDLGQAYLGTQGDSWDSQKDSLLATSGALLAALVLRARRARASRKEPPEWEI